MPLETINDLEPAASVRSKLNLAIGEVNDRDALIPSADEKAALVGTEGASSGTNKFVTNADPRNSDARAPTAHAATHATGEPDAIAPAAIGASTQADHDTLAGRVTTNEFDIGGLDSRTDALELTAPLEGEKKALEGTQGLPSVTNKYVTDEDARMTDSRTPSAHASTHASAGGDPLSPSDIGLGNVDNTSDANKPVSTAQQTALDLKQNILTNAVRVTGAGTPEANEIYVPDGVQEGHPRFRNIRFRDIVIVGNGTAPSVAWELQNNAIPEPNNILYASGTNGATPWEAADWFFDSGTAPEPTVTQATVEQVQEALATEKASINDLQSTRNLTMTGNITITKTDARYQYLNPDSVNRNVNISDTWVAGDAFVFKNTGTAGVLIIQNATVEQARVQPGYSITVQFDANLAFRILSLDAPTSRLSVIAAGVAAYDITTTAAAVTFSVQNPVLTLPQKGRWNISMVATLRGAGLTIDDKTVTIKTRRTNNTAADLTGGGTTLPLEFVGAVDTVVATINLPLPEYVTANADDDITIFAELSGAATAGEVQVSEARLIAQWIGF